MPSQIPIILVSVAQGSIRRANPDIFDALVDKPYDEKRLIETLPGFGVPWGKQAGAVAF